MDFAGDGVRSVQTNGRQITVMASRNADAIVERAYGLGAVSVETTAVGLRKLFLDTVTEHA